MDSTTTLKNTAFHKTSVGKKVIMSLTGLFLISFLVVHLSGNLLLLKNDNGLAFNAYAEFMSHNGIIRTLEIGLLLGFLAHIYYAFILTRGNQNARPINYAHNRASENSTWFSRNMGITGSILLIFIILHLYQFFAQTRFGFIGHSQLYSTVREAFMNPIYALLYIAAMVLMGFHLVHGAHSVFQSLGLKVNVSVGNIIHKIMVGLAILLTLGYIYLPVHFQIVAMMK